LAGPGVAAFESGGVVFGDVWARASDAGVTHSASDTTTIANWGRSRVGDLNFIFQYRLDSALGCL